MSDDEKADLYIAVVCSSNLNRSMEAHSFLRKRGFNVRSFGTGQYVKLPGPAADKPNIYPFTMSYDDIHQDLTQKDRSLYTQNGILHMLDRNRRLKPMPEKFKDCSDKFDIVISCEERVFDAIIEDLENREKENSQLVHVINIDIQDNHEEATLGAFMICEIVEKLAESQDMDNEIDEILTQYEERINRPVLHTVCFY